VLITKDLQKHNSLKNHQLTNKNLSGITKNIIATLAYFDVFNYPLTHGELFLFLGDKCDSDVFDSALLYLILNDNVYRFDGFYTLKNDPDIAPRRRAANTKATALIKTARKVGQILIKFPYVRGIAISGSLSKNFADDNSDIDLFIITAPNRLWIARTMMHLLKKVSFLFKMEHYFCMNYFIDEAGLEIAEKNLYTATEVVTLIPLEGDIAFDKFYSANNWTLNYLPNNYMRLASAKPLMPGIAKSIIEFLFNGRTGNLIDNLLQNTTSSRWLKKTQQKKVNSKGIVMGMSAGKHFAKPDPVNFQQKLIAKYENKVRELLTEDENNLAHV
jgi:predicted nucleotidyltransferase